MNMYMEREWKISSVDWLQICEYSKDWIRTNTNIVSNYIIKFHKEIKEISYYYVKNDIIH